MWDPEMEMSSNISVYLSNGFILDYYKLNKKVQNLNILGTYVKVIVKNATSFIG